MDDEHACDACGEPTEHYAIVENIGETIVVWMCRKCQDEERERSTE